MLASLTSLSSSLRAYFANSLSTKHHCLKISSNLCFARFSSDASKPLAHDEKKEKVYKPIIGPGPSLDQPPTDFDMAVGLERLEYLAKTHGINIFDTEWLPGDRFGTYNDPILVEATGEDRIIGCNGAYF